MSIQSVKDSKDIEICAVQLKFKNMKRVHGAIRKIARQQNIDMSCVIIAGRVCHNSIDQC